MRYIIENKQIRVEIDSFGAELRSVKDVESGREYMWQADPKFWGRTSPVLFPFVGSLKDKKYIWQGKEYPMGQHGFARDMEFELLEQKPDEILFVLKSNEETLAKYPFDFALTIGYRIHERKVDVIWKVENTGTNTMHFSIGAHPAFNCPIYGEDSYLEYYLTFGDADEIHHHGNDGQTGLAIREDIVIKLQDHMVDITNGFFDRCTYMIEDKQTDKCGIADKNRKQIVEMTFDTPLFAIWSPEGKNAPFICIEPWYGRCDAEDFSGDLSEREFSNALEAAGVFERSYSMEFFAL